ncbi:MAG: hypothetical protein ACLGIY_00215, partial [Betaproteobacteria bacterium]
KRLKKAGSKTIPEPGSVSRLAGSAHRWDELYADGVQGKTTQSRTNCSSIENNLSEPSYALFTAFKACSSFAIEQRGKELAALNLLTDIPGGQLP